MAPNRGKPKREEIDDPDIPRWEPEREPEREPEETPVETPEREKEPV